MDELFNALKTAYGKGSKYGVSDEVIGRVAALGATANLNAEQIAAFVAAAEPKFKEEQSEADKVRSSYAAKLKELEAAKAELEAKLNGNPQPEPNPEPEKIDIEAIINAAVAKQKAESDKTIETLASRITEFESKQAAKDVMMSFQEKLSNDSYVNGFPKQKANALKFLMRDYERGGNAMTEKELQDGFSEYFNAFVDSKGNDGHRPFQSDGASGGDNNFDTSEITRALQEKGNLPKE